MTYPPEIRGLTFHRRIGRGRFGEVWLATEDATHTRRAVKLIPKDDSPPIDTIELNGVMEYQQVALGQRHLLQVLHVAEAPSCYYMLMELADDLNGAAVSSVESYEPKTLEGVLRHRQKLPPAQALDITAQVLRGLAVLHERGRLHRDVKPANVLFVNGEVKLGDPGLVTAMGELRDSSGSVGYVPRDDRPDQSRDLFAVGRMLYRMLTGWHPTQFPELPDNLFVHMSDHRMAADCRAAIRLMNKAAHPEAAKGFQTAAEMLRAIERWRRRPWVRRHPVAFAGTVAIVVILTLTGIGWIDRLTSSRQDSVASALQPYLTDARLGYEGETGGRRHIELLFSDETTCRFQPGGGFLNSVVAIDPTGDGRRLLVVGFDAFAAKGYAGAVVAFDPSVCRNPTASPPVFVRRICEEPPKAFGEPRGPCHMMVLGATDLDGKPGEELIVASVHHRGPAQLIVFGTGGTRLGDYWHFGWPVPERAVTPVLLDVAGRPCVAFPLIANVVQEGHRRELADETCHIAILVLDAATLLGQRQRDTGTTRFWSINDWMNRVSSDPPVAYGHLARGYRAYGGGKWRLLALKRFAGPSVTILELVLVHDWLIVELDPELNLLDLRVANRQKWDEEGVDAESVWVRTWPPP